MTITTDDVRMMASLAAMDVPESELAVVAMQLGRILEYVEQLSELPDENDGEAFRVGPDAVALREDRVIPSSASAALERMAPELVQHLFVVPRRGLMEDE